MNRPGGAATPGAAPGAANAEPGAPNPPESLIPDYAARSRDILQGKGNDNKAIDSNNAALTVNGVGQTNGANSNAQKDGDSRLASHQPPRERPLVVSSLADGVQAKSLKDFLSEAETLMKQGKFYSALDQYDSAEMIAPNNAMVMLGRANAELGASCYMHRREPPARGVHEGQCAADGTV